MQKKFREEKHDLHNQSTKQKLSGEINEYIV
jgi:hypothetical protein